MRRAILIVLGLIVGLVGVPLIVAGVALLVLFGTDGTAFTPVERYQVESRALVTEPAVIFDDGAPRDWAPRGWARLVVEAERLDGGEVFVGIGPTAAVDEYLDGVPHDLITRVDYAPFRLETAPQPGEATPDPPTEVDLWVAQASGPGLQEVRWDVDRGSYRLVVMNADASSGVDVSGRLGARVPFVLPLAIGLLVAGVLLAVLGLVLLILGVSRRDEPRSGAWGPPPGAPPGPRPEGWGPAPAPPASTGAPVGGGPARPGPAAHTDEGRSVSEQEPRSGT